MLVLSLHTGFEHSDVQKQDFGEVTRDHNTASGVKFDTSREKTPKLGPDSEMFQ